MASVPLQGTTAAHLPSSAHIPAAPSWRWVCGASARLLQHMMHEIKRRGMFRQMFRGDYLELRTFLKPTAHLAVGKACEKLSTPPQTKPTATVPPPRLYQPGREVPELTDVPGPHRWPLFGGAR